MGVAGGGRGAGGALEEAGGGGGAEEEGGRVFRRIGESRSCFCLGGMGGVAMVGRRLRRHPEGVTK